MTRLVTILLTTLLLAACGDPSGTDVYDLDQQHFSKHMAKVLVDSGKFPPQMKSQLETMLLDTVFNLKLYPDNSFSVHQKQGPEQRSYTGTWRLNGTTFELNQTHQDGKPLRDKLTGTLVDGMIEVTGIDQDTKHKYTMKLHRSSSAATAPR